MDDKREATHVAGAAHAHETDGPIEEALVEYEPAALVRTRQRAEREGGMSTGQVSIRAIGNRHKWELVSSRGCCAFAWHRDDSLRGVLCVNEAAHDECQREVLDYARRRAYRIEWNTALCRTDS
jgi:hypothetical protein